MSKYLVVIVGHNYLNPMVVCGDIEYVIKNLTNESHNNNYIYSIYTFNEKYEYYATYCVIYRGDVSYNEGARIDGIRIVR